MMDAEPLHQIAPRGTTPGESTAAEPHELAAQVDHESLVVDCDRCVVRGPRACGDCVVSVLLGGPPQGVEIDAEEQAALDVLADGGLVPPLRLVVPVNGPQPPSAC